MIRIEGLPIVKARLRSRASMIERRARPIVGSLRPRIEPPAYLRS